MKQAAKKLAPVLTNREREILQGIWNGFTSRQLGQALSISVKTVEAHRAAIIKKGASPIPRSSANRNGLAPVR